MKNAFWEKFLAETGRDAGTQFSWSISFGMNREDSNRAAAKVCSGEKTAVIYPANGYRANMSAPSVPGDLHLICDWQQNPVAVVEVESVEMLSLHELNDAICIREAEAGSLEEWRKLRMPAVKTEIEELGGEFTEDAPLICENFRLVYPCA